MNQVGEIVHGCRILRPGVSKLPAIPTATHSTTHMTVCYMNVIFICAAVADEALAPSQIHVAVLRC